MAHNSTFLYSACLIVALGPRAPVVQAHPFQSYRFQVAGGTIALVGIGVILWGRHVQQNQQAEKKRESDRLKALQQQKDIQEQEDIRRKVPMWAQQLEDAYKWEDIDEVLCDITTSKGLCRSFQQTFTQEYEHTISAATQKNQAGIINNKLDKMTDNLIPLYSIFH